MVQRNMNKSELKEKIRREHDYEDRDREYGRGRYDRY